MAEIVIVGAGGFGRELAHWAAAAFAGTGHRLAGFVSKDRRDVDEKPVGLPWLGDDAAFPKDRDQRFLLGIGDPRIRRRVAERLREQGARFLTVVHPTAVVAPTARLGEGVVLCPFAVVSDHVTLGDFVQMNFHASVGHDAAVGAFSVLTPCATVNGYAVLDEEVFLGSHATVGPSVRVGRRARVAANSAALRDVPAGALVLGVPGVARVIPAP